MKYNQELIKKVREGKAQVQADKDDKWNDLLNEIFQKSESIVLYNYYYYLDSGCNFGASIHPKNLPTIHASEFEVKEVKWVEVSDDKVNWYKRIFVIDLGKRFYKPIITVTIDNSYNYTNGDSDIFNNQWFFMREIPEIETLTHKELEELIGKPFKYVEK